MKQRVLRMLTSVLLTITLLTGALVAAPSTASAYTKPTGYDAAKKKVIQYCYNILVSEMGLTPAGACGVLANIDAESDFDPTDVSPAGGKLYHGLFQLTDDRWDRLVAYCEKIGVSENSVEGQMRYIAIEHTLTSYEAGQYQKFLNSFTSYGNTEQAAYKAGYAWAQYIERCNERYFAVRGNYAKDDFWPIYSKESVDIADCTVHLSNNSFTYTGTNVVPVVTVIDPEGKDLSLGTHYTLSFSHNNSIGTAKVTIKGIGTCSGSVTKDFQINMDVAHINTLSNTASAVKVTWRKVPGATSYRIYRKTASGSQIGLDKGGASHFATDSNGDLVYNDATAVAGTTYTYIVRAYCNIDGTETGFGYDKTGMDIVRLSVPKLQTSSIGSAGLNVKWEKVDSADQYRVYRKSSLDSKLREVARVDGSKTSWSDPKAESNVTYTYTVRAYSGSTQSDFDRTGTSLRFVGTPQLAGLSNTDTGLKFTWKAVAGAERYRVYRREKGTSTWAKMADVAGSRLYWLDTTAVGGKTYEYTVRARIGSTYGSYITKGIAGTRLDTPALLRINNSDVGLAVYWQQVAGAEKYQIYRYTNNTKKWELVHTSSATSRGWSDNTTTDGDKYTYTVRAVSSASGSKMLSGFDASGITMYRLAPITVTNLASSKAGTITLNWKKNSNVSGYLIQYATDESFKSPTGVFVKNGNATSHTIAKLSRGKKLYVRIRAYKSVDGKNYYTCWSAESSVKVR